MWKISKKEPKVEALVEKELPYDHANKNSIESCGLTHEQTKDMQSLTIQFIEESDSFSEMCEKMESAFSKRELAFLATQHVAGAMKKAIIASKVEKIFDDIEHLM
jgi:hypothetical protein